MKSYVWLMVPILLFAVACKKRSDAPSQESESAFRSPAEVYEAYYKALKQGDHVTAMALTAGSEHIPGDIFRESVLDLSEGARAGRLAILPETFGERIEQDFAVVICDGNKIHIDDYRAVYLRKDGQEWKLLWTGTIWDHPSNALSDPQREQLRTLQGWFESKKKELPERKVE